MAGCWKKLLYIKQDYPDNYLDEKQFEKDLKKNLNLPKYDFPQVTKASLSVLQELNSVYLFVLVFWLLNESKISALPLLGVIVFTSCTMFLVNYRYLQVLGNVVKPLTSESLEQSILLFTFLCGTSPLITTLTESISTDTIWLMTVVMFLIHLLFHDFGLNKDSPIASDSFSLNAAIFSAVCLASRLHSSLQTLVIMMLAILLFAFLPHLRNDLQCLCPSIAYLLVPVVCTVTGCLIFCLFSMMGVLLYVVQTLFITIVCPYWFIRLQYLKRVINGPWDIPTIRLS